MSLPDASQIEEQDKLQEAAPDLEYPPDRAVIRTIRLAFKGTFSSGDVTNENEAPSPGAGGIVNMVENLIVSNVSANYHLNPSAAVMEKAAPHLQGVQPPEMFPDVVEIMEKYMEANAEYKRPPWRESWKETLFELLTSGAVTAERIFPGFESYKAIQEAMDKAMELDKQEGPSVNHWAIFNDYPCENVIIRGLEHCIINRSHYTGIILNNPFWFKSEISEEYTEEDYNGPLNINQCVYFTWQRGKSAAHYGQSFFAHVVTEIVEVGRIYRIAQQSAKFYTMPIPVFYVKEGLSERDFERVVSQGKVFLSTLDAAKYERGVTLPGGQKLELLTPGVRYDELTDWLKYLHETILEWCRIPTTLLMPESNRSVGELHYKIFQDMISEIRHTAWEGWETTHFRPMLREAGFTDWDVTPITIVWEDNGVVIDIAVSGNQEIALVRRNTPVYSQNEPGVEYYQGIRQNMGMEMNPMSQDVMSMIGGGMSA